MAEQAGRRRAIEPADVPKLEGWVTLADAASQMKLSKNGLRKRVFDYGEFPGVRQVGDDSSSMFLLPAEAVAKAVAEELHEREHFQTVRQPEIQTRKARAEQRKKIIEWAHSKGYETAKMGRLPTALLEAYQQDNPGVKII